MSDKHKYIVRCLHRAQAYLDHFDSPVGEVPLESFRYLMEGHVLKFIMVPSPQANYALWRIMKEEIEFKAKNMGIDIDMAQKDFEESHCQCIMKTISESK